MNGSNPAGAAQSAMRKRLSSGYGNHPVGAMKTLIFIAKDVSIGGGLTDVIREEVILDFRSGIPTLEGVK
jgi:hypothetical protein